jgi:TonB family protein
MAPVTKEPETLSSTQSSAGTTSPAGAKAQPAAAEIPVTVNGARSVEGTDRREPFSEKTQTVLVFANGGVIRLSSPVSSGQLLFLTNEKSKKEVVCQVVKSRNYSSVSGYVELEFTEPAPGFWGMRLPSSETPASAPSLAKPSATIPAPTIPAHAKPVEEATAKTNTTNPDPTQPSAPVFADKTSPEVIETAPHRPAPLPQQSAVPADRPTNTKPAPVANEQKLSGGRKIQTLSEFLSHSESDPELKPERTKPVVQSVRQTQPKPGEAAKTTRDEEGKKSLTSLLVPASARENPAPGTYTFDFAADEVKIPAWLEPLARNSSTTSTSPETRTPATDELNAKDLERKEILAEPAETLTPSSNSNEYQKTPLHSLRPAAQDSDSDQEAIFTLSGDAPAPNFSSSLAFDAKSGESEGVSQELGAGLKFGLLAAGLLLLVGGGWYWYSNQPQGITADGTAVATSQVSSAAPASTSSLSTPNESSSQLNKPNISVNSANVDTNRSALTSQTVRTDNKGFGIAANGVSKPSVTGDRLETLSGPARQSQAEPITPPLTEPEKKPTLGHVRLAAPVIGQRDFASNSNNVADAPPMLGDSEVTASDSGSSNMLASKSNQPAAPIPVGGDVRPARLLTTVAPAYPQMARNQHVSGDVKIDALVDAGGRVSAMKVISGSALLHQAAQEAVRQWKYEPATLNGHPVPMHLIVTVQFKLQ